MALVTEYTVREALRQRLVLLLGTLAGAMAGGTLLLRDLNFGTSELKFLMDAGLGAQSAFGAILAIVAMTQLFYAELDRRSALMVLARPVGRMEYVLGKLGGVLLLLLGFCALMTGLLLVLLWWRGTGLQRANPEAVLQGPLVPYRGVAWSGLVLWLKLGVLTAMTLLVASYARSSLFTILAGFSLFAICQLQHLIRDFLGLMEWPWARSLAGVIRLLVPDFQLLNVADRVVSGETISGGLLRAIAVYAWAYIAGFGVLAGYYFRHREL